MVATDADGNQQKSIYDSLGNPLVVQMPDPGTDLVSGINTPGDSPVMLYTYHYDADRLAIATTSRLGVTGMEGNLPNIDVNHEHSRVLREVRNTNGQTVLVAARVRNMGGSDELETFHSFLDTDFSMRQSMTLEPGGLASSVIDANGSTTYQDYDHHGSGTGAVKRALQPNGELTISEYDSAGNLVEYRSGTGQGNMTSWDHDGIGRTTYESVSLDELGANGLPNGSARTATRNWNFSGLSTAYTDRNGRVITTVLDPADRTETTTYQVQSGALTDTMTTHMHSDGLTQMISHAKPDGDSSSTSYVYDAFGRIDDVLDTFNYGGAMLPGVSHKFGYSDTGVRSSHVLQLDITNDQASNFVTAVSNDYPIDGLLRVQGMSQDVAAASSSLWSGGQVANDKAVALSYNADGQRTKLTRFDEASFGSTAVVGYTEQEYYPEGRVQNTSHHRADDYLLMNVGLAEMDFGAFIAGDLANDGDLDGDDINLLTNSIGSGNPNVSYDLDGSGTVDFDDVEFWLLNAGLSNIGNPYPIGDANLDGAVDELDFDAWSDNRFTDNMDWTDGNFNADNATDGSDFNRWNSVRFTGSSIHGFTYDDEGRLTERKIHYYGSDNSASLIHSENQNFIHDASGQVTSVGGGPFEDIPTEQYLTGIDGNRYTTTETVIGLGNRLYEDRDYRYSYDDEGNLTDKARKDGTESTTYDWDARNRLTGITTTRPDGETVVSYFYDGLGRRVLKNAVKTGATPGTESFGYVFDGSTQVLELDMKDGGKIVRNYVYGPGVNEQVAIDQASSASTNETIWQFGDLVGTVRTVGTADSSGDWSVVHRNYDEFGAPQPFLTESDALAFETFVGDTSDAGLTGAPQIYGGHYFDTDTQKYITANRWLDPNSGRWISKDPIGFAAGDSNLYRYVGNNPTNATDPSGLQRVKLAGAKVVGVTVGTPALSRIEGGISWTGTLDPGTVTIEVLEGNAGAKIRARWEADVTYLISTTQGYGPPWWRYQQQCLTTVTRREVVYKYTNIPSARVLFGVGVFLGWGPTGGGAAGFAFWEIAPGKGDYPFATRWAKDNPPLKSDFPKPINQW